jgi:LacI family transcriptional regulator
MASMSALSQQGIIVGKEVAVVGYDDIDIAEYTSPPMTSVHTPLEEVTRNACHQLLNLCYGESLPVQNRFSPELSIRESSRDWINRLKT